MNKVIKLEKSSVHTLSGALVDSARHRGSRAIGPRSSAERAITTHAGVNLAAVNYHFGSKEELFQAVLTRRLDPMNQDDSVQDRHEYCTSDAETAL